MGRSAFFRVCVVLAVSASSAAMALAQPTPSYGIDFVTVGAVNNLALNLVNPDNPGSFVTGRGSVGYEFRIGKFEVTTAQWLQFANVAYSDPTAPYSSFMSRFGPTFWGAQSDLTYTGPGQRWEQMDVPGAEMRPVFGVGWRDAALYCNWLHNGQSTDPLSLMTGAYDVSTWGRGPAGSFTDQVTHLPGALFWIPTMDEQLKATHYDANRYGSGQGGWWIQKNGRDVPSIPGPPGVGQTSAGWVDPDVQGGEYDIPLGSYPDQMSPWGLLDTSGGTREWNEEAFPFAPELPIERGIFGRAAGGGGAFPADAVWAVSSGGPGISNKSGLRIASAVPSPPTLGVLALAGVLTSGRRRRSTE